MVEHATNNAQMRSKLLEQIQRDKRLHWRGGSKLESPNWDYVVHLVRRDLAMQLVSFLKQQPLTLDSTCSFKVNSDMPLSLTLEEDLRRSGLCWHYSGKSDSQVLHLYPIGWWSLVLRPLDRGIILKHILPRVGGAEADDSGFRIWTEHRRNRLKLSIKRHILNWEMRIKLLERLDRVPYGYWIDELFTELEQEPVTLSSTCIIKLSSLGIFRGILISKLEGSSLWRYRTGPESARVLHFMPRGWWALVLEPLDRDVIETHILPRIREDGSLNGTRDSFLPDEYYCEECGIEMEVDSEAGSDFEPWPYCDDCYCFLSHGPGF